MEKHEFVKHATSSLCAEIVDGLETGLPVVCERSEFDPIHVPAQPEQRQWEETFPACLHCGHPGEHHDEEFGNCQESTDPKCECPGYEAAVQPANEPERVSDDEITNVRETLDDYHVAFAKIEAELRTLRTQLADRDNHIATAYAALDGFLGCGCRVSRSIYLFDHIRKLKEQLAEKDAAIEKARRDALEEAAKHIEDGSTYSGYSGVGEIHAGWLRALAAQKKEG